MNELTATARAGAALKTCSPPPSLLGVPVAIHDRDGPELGAYAKGLGLFIAVCGSSLLMWSGVIYIVHATFTHI